MNPPPVFKLTVRNTAAEADVVSPLSTARVEVTTASTPHQKVASTSTARTAQEAGQVKALQPQ